MGLKGATAFTASSDNMYVALNVQNNIAMTLSALVGFIVSTVYVIVYFAAGGKDNPEYRKSFRRIGRAYLVLTSGSFLTLLACAVVPSVSVMYGLLFYVFLRAISRCSCISRTRTTRRERRSSAKNTRSIIR